MAPERKGLESAKELTKLGINREKKANGLCTKPFDEARSKLLNNPSTHRTGSCRQLYKPDNCLKNMDFKYLSTENIRA